MTTTAPRPAVARTPSESADRFLLAMSEPHAWIWYVGAHAVLGVLASLSPAVATLHLVVVLGSVIVVGVLARNPTSILIITMYAGVSDVLWRSTSARGPYEGAKYALIIGFTLLIVRFMRHPRNGGTVLVLLLCLVPGVMLGAMQLEAGSAREVIVTTIAGLVAVAIAIAACANLRMDRIEARGLYLVVIGPIVAVCASATWATITADDLTFTDEVNFTTSGGYGPNQVSSLLAMGGLLCVLVALQPGSTWRLRLTAVAVASWLVGQAVLTFSRGGLFGLVVALACVGLTALTTSGQRMRTLLAGVVLVLIGLQLLSWAGAFTDGASDQRLVSVDSTDREVIGRAEIEVFLDKPFTGVGVGLAPYERAHTRIVSSHTEYTRLLAEQGLLGLVVLALLGVLVVRIVRSTSSWHRLAAVGLVVLALSQMTHSATRIGCIAVAFGLASIREDS